MQRIYLLVFSFSVFLLSFTPLSGAFAKSDLAFAKSDLAFAEALSPTPTAQINYELPYPGLLPDNPLYFLRIIRDKTVGFLISDPLKKTEFDLLQADKRLNAGIYLFDKGKTSLALSTVSKAENYFSEALDKMKEAKTQGMNINDMKNKLKDAARKHQQELKYFVAKSSVNFVTGFKNELKRVTGFEQRLNQ